MAHRSASPTIAACFKWRATCLHLPAGPENIWADRGKGDVVNFRFLVQRSVAIAIVLLCSKNVLSAAVRALISF